MSTTMSSPIYYGYNGSPFVSKLETILLLRNISARRVDVALTPPRPELSTLLGLPYRRVPVLALGRDIYADTSLITSALEGRFPAPHHPTIFPPRKGTTQTDTGLQKALGLFYADKHLFDLGFGLLPWTKLPPALQADRKKFVGREVDFAAMAKQKSVTQSTLVSHLTLYEEQLGDGRDWFMNTDTPAFVDVSIYFALAWMRSFRDTRPIFDASQFPLTVSWLNKMDAILKTKQQASPPPLTKVDGADAAREILSSPFLDISSIGFDAVEGNRLGLELGTRISVRPADTGRSVGTFGTLVALNREEVVLETEATEGGPRSIRVHFPRLGYIIQPASATPTKL